MTHKELQPTSKHGIVNRRKKSELAHKIQSFFISIEEHKAGNQCCVCVFFSMNSVDNNVDGDDEKREKQQESEKSEKNTS